MDTVHGRPINSAYMHVHSYRRRTDTQVDSAGHDLYKSIVALLVGKPPLTRDFGPVEVKGFEPSSSALRMSGSRCFDQGFPRTFLVAAFRSPQLPSRSLSFPLGKDTRKDTPEPSRKVTTDRYSRPIGWLSQCRAKWRLVPLLATITFLGKEQDFTDPWSGGAVEQTAEHQCRSLQQPAPKSRVDGSALHLRDFDPCRWWSCVAR